MNINTQQLRYFMELAKCLNFTRAAANLYVAQPTLSQQIAELEAQLGVSLFVRNSRSVTLTPAGEILYAAFPDLSAQLSNLHQRMLVTAAGFSGSLNVGFLDALADSIPMIMRNFRTHFPDVSVTPVCATQSELLKGLKNGTIDVAFSMTLDTAMEGFETFERKQCLRDPMCFVFPADQPVPSPQTVDESRPVILFNDHTAIGHHAHVCRCLKRLGIPMPQVIFTDSLTNLWTYLESGMGFSLQPKKYRMFFSENIQFVPIPEEYMEFGVLWNPNSSNPALPLFLDSLDQFLNPVLEEDAQE